MLVWSNDMPHWKEQPVEYRIVSYRERNRVLKSMGFSSYQAYLDSDLWKTIRDKVLVDDARCVCCGVLATQVHHEKYRKKDLEGRCLSFLHPVCGRCHTVMEFDDDEKMNVKQANKRMRDIIAGRPPESMPRVPLTDSTIDQPPARCQDCNNCCKRGLTVCKICQKTRRKTRAARNKLHDAFRKTV